MSDRATFEVINKPGEPGKVEGVRRPLDRQKAAGRQRVIVKMEPVHRHNATGLADPRPQIGSDGRFATARRAGNRHRGHPAPVRQSRDFRNQPVNISDP